MSLECGRVYFCKKNSYSQSSTWQYSICWTRRRSLLWCGIILYVLQAQKIQNCRAWKSVRAIKNSSKLPIADCRELLCNIPHKPISSAMKIDIHRRISKVSSFALDGQTSTCVAVLVLSSSALAVVIFHRLKNLFLFRYQLRQMSSTVLASCSTHSQSPFTVSHVFSLLLLTEFDSPEK